MEKPNVNYDFEVVEGSGNKIANMTYTIEVKLSLWFKLFKLCQYLPDFLRLLIVRYLKKKNPVLITIGGKSFIRFNEVFEHEI